MRPAGRHSGESRRAGEQRRNRPSAHRHRCHAWNDGRQRRDDRGRWRGRHCGRRQRAERSLRELELSRAHQGRERIDVPDVPGPSARAEGCAPFPHRLRLRDRVEQREGPGHHSSGGRLRGLRDAEVAGRDGQRQVLQADLLHAQLRHRRALSPDRAGDRNDRGARDRSGGRRCRVRQSGGERAARRRRPVGRSGGCHQGHEDSRCGVRGTARAGHRPAAAARPAEQRVFRLRQRRSVPSRSVCAEGDARRLGVHAGAHLRRKGRERRVDAVGGDLRGVRQPRRRRLHHDGRSVHGVGERHIERSHGGLDQPGDRCPADAVAGAGLVLLRRFQHRRRRESR